MTAKASIRLDIQGEAEIQAALATVKAEGAGAFDAVGAAATQAGSKAQASLAEMRAAGMSLAQIKAQIAANIATANERLLQAPEASPAQLSRWRAQGEAARKAYEAGLANQNFDRILGIGGAGLPARYSAEAFARGGGLSTAGRTNLFYQASDIAVQLQGGINPAVIALQQGSQILPTLTIEAERAGTSLGALALKWGPVAAGAGLVAAGVYEVVKAAKAQQKAFEDTINISGKLDEINHKLASSSSALAPVLLAEAAAMEKAAKAAKAKADADLARFNQVQKHLEEYGPEQASLNYLFRGANLQRNADFAAANVLPTQWATEQKDLEARLVQVREAKQQLSSGFDLSGRALTKAATAELQANLKANLAFGQQVVDGWTQRRDTQIAVGTKQLQEAAVGGLQSARDLIAASLPEKTGAARASRAPGPDLAALRAALTAENALALAQASGDQAHIQALQDQARLQKLIKDFRETGLSQAAASSAAGRQVGAENVERTTAGLKDYLLNLLPVRQALQRQLETELQLNIAQQGGDQARIDALNQELRQRSLINQLREAYPELDPDQLKARAAKQIADEAAAAAKLKADLAAAALAQQAFNEQLERGMAYWQEIRRAGENVLDDLNEALTPDHWGDWGQAGRAVLRDLTADFERLALLNPLKNALFGGDAYGRPLPTISSAGGFLGDLFKGGRGPDPYAGIMAAAGAPNYSIWTGLGGAIKHLFGFADGTFGAPEGYAWVGERGPELRRLRAGDQITSNGGSLAMVKKALGQAGAGASAAAPVFNLNTVVHADNSVTSQELKETIYLSHRLAIDRARKLAAEDAPYVVAQAQRQGAT